MDSKGNRFGESAKSIMKSIISGDILLRLRVDKLFPYILYAFSSLTITISYLYYLYSKVNKNIGSSDSLHKFKCIGY